MAGTTSWPAKTNVPELRAVTYKFFPDAGNQPTVPTGPLNQFISSIVWVSQGIYRITLRGTYANLASHVATINVNATGVARYAQGGPVANLGTSTPVTVDVLVVDGSGAVQNPPAANSNNWISGTINFCDATAV